DPTLPDRGDDAYREATLLQIRLRYWYEMRVPFASHVIFLAWFASNSGVALHGAIDRSATQGENMVGPSGDASALARSGRGISVQHGYASVAPSEMAVLWELASAQRRFFLPLSATQSMRMQSSFHRKWVMHP